MCGVIILIFLIVVGLPALAYYTNLISIDLFWIVLNYEVFGILILGGIALLIAIVKVAWDWINDMFF